MSTRLSPSHVKRVIGTFTEKLFLISASEAPAAFTLILAEDKLVILSQDGERVYERTTDASRLHPKDRERLTAGISFETREEAMSAVYDLIS